MGKYFFIASSMTVFLTLNALIFYFPGAVEGVTGLNTDSLQEDTNVSTSVDSNVSETSALDQAGNIAAIYSQPETSNRILGAILTIYLMLLGLLLVDIVWVG